MTSGSRREGELILTAGEVATLVRGRIEGDPSVRVSGIVPLDEAGPDEMGFLADRRYLGHLGPCGAGSLLVSEDLADEAAGFATRVIASDPYEALRPLLAHLHPEPPTESGVHPTAVLGKGVRLGAGVRIGPYAVLEEAVEIGDGVSIGAHACVGRGSRIGNGSILHPHVVLYPGSVVGERAILHAGVRLGVDGFGYVFTDGEHRKLPQVGGCIVEDDVEIGANSTLDRGSIGNTVVAEGSKLDNLVHLGHNVRVGARSLLVAQVGIAGSTRLGEGVACGGQVGVSGHLEIGDRARLAAQAGVIGDIAPGETVSGYPARRHRDYLRGMALVLRLPGLFRRILALEKRTAPARESEGSSED